MLFAVGGYSHKEIAAVLEKPYATVRWKYSLSLIHILNCMGRVRPPRRLGPRKDRFVWKTIAWN